MAGLSRASDRRPLLVAVPARTEAEALAADLVAFLGIDEVEELPAWETLPFERVSPSIHTMGRRCRVLHRMANPARTPAVVVASARALAQFVASEAAAGPITLRRGDSVDQLGLVQRLSEFGYRREHQVEHRGEMAVRGLDRRRLSLDGLGAGAHRLLGRRCGPGRGVLGGRPAVHDFLGPGRGVSGPGAATRRGHAAAGRIAGGEPALGPRAVGPPGRGELFEGMESWWPWLAERLRWCPACCPPAALWS